MNVRTEKNEVRKDINLIKVVRRLTNDGLCMLKEGRKEGGKSEKF